MKSIFKYPIQIMDVQKVTMPFESKILCAQMQRDQLCLWAEVAPDSPLHPRTIEIFGTGHAMDDSSRIYIGTVQMIGGGLIWHVYERLSP
jgi:hypothetical protein